jgi:hypothetical protein
MGRQVPGAHLGAQPRVELIGLRSAGKPQRVYSIAGRDGATTSAGSVGQTL